VHDTNSSLPTRPRLNLPRCYARKGSVSIEKTPPSPFPFSSMTPTSTGTLRSWAMSSLVESPSLSDYDFLSPKEGKTLSDAAAPSFSRTLTRRICMGISLSRPVFLVLQSFPLCYRHPVVWRWVVFPRRLPQGGRDYFFYPYSRTALRETF